MYAPHIEAGTGHIAQADPYPVDIPGWAVAALWRNSWQADHAVPEAVQSEQE